jgi:hypothetical protein
LLESGLLFFALAAYFFPEPQVQAFALLILWAFLLKKNSPWAWLCLILCSCLPLLLSPQALNANHISLQNYYAYLLWLKALGRSVGWVLDLRRFTFSF